MLWQRDKGNREESQKSASEIEPPACQHPKPAMPMTPIMNHIIVIIPSRARGDHGREERKEADKMRSNMPIVDTSCMQDHHGGRSGGLGSESLIRHDFAKTVRTELTDTRGRRLACQKPRRRRNCPITCDVRPLHIAIKIQDNRLRWSWRALRRDLRERA